jgi:hypothetical protein
VIEKAGLVIRRNLDFHKEDLPEFKRRKTELFYLQQTNIIFPDIIQSLQNNT